MHDACHINKTWGRKEVGQLKLYEGGKPESGQPSFCLGGGGGGVGERGRVNLSRHYALKAKRHHFLDISLHSTKGYSRYKTKAKVKNSFIQPSPTLIKNTKEIRIC